MYFQNCKILATWLTNYFCTALCYLKNISFFKVCIVFYYHKCIFSLHQLDGNNAVFETNIGIKVLPCEAGIRDKVRSSFCHLLSPH